MSFPASARPLTPATGSPLPPDAGTATRVSLVALATVLAIDGVRASGPMLDRVFTIGTETVAVVAPATFFGAGLLAALALMVTGRRGTGTASGSTVLVAAVALGVARLVTQATHDVVRFGAGMVTASLAVATLVLAATLVAGRVGGGRQAAAGLTLGTGLSAALQLVLGTWDSLWRGGVVGATVAVLLVVLTVGLAAVCRPQTATGRPRRTWVLGPALAVALMALANPAFAASQSGVSLLVAGSVVVLAAALTVWLLLVPRVLVPAVRVCAAVLLPVSIALAFLLPSAAALIALAVAQAATGVVLASALSTRRPAPPGIPRTALATGAVGVVMIAFLMVYLLDYDVPLGVDNAWVVVLAAALVAAGGLRWQTPSESQDREPAPPLRANALRLLVLPSVLLLLVGWVQNSDAPARAADSTPDELVVLSWNLHFGVATDTAVDLEKMAQTIEAQDPDVVMLQEVARGWLLGGGVDMATWLGNRLNMRVEFAPAADRQFGNALLSRKPLSDIEVINLPYGDGPQTRSAVTGIIDGPDGNPVRVTSVHLQHWDKNTPTRLEQLAVLDAALPDDGPSVLAGDLNARPRSPELTALAAAGWTSAIDTAGDPEALTHPADTPVMRIDWVLGRGVTFTDARVLTDDSSDHLAIVTRVSVD